MTDADTATAETTETAWDAPPLRVPASAAPVLSVAGFEGPLDWLLEMARAQRIDLAQLSIVELVDAFVAALDAALAQQAARADLSRWGEWLVMAASLALLRSRLLLPPDAPEARAAEDEAEAIRRQLLERAAIRAAAEWLDHRMHLGRDVFVRGEVAGAGARRGRTTDVTELFRACLVALRVPDQVDAYQLRFVNLWRVPDAMARIAEMLAMRPEGGALGSFLPGMDREAADRELRCRAALASTFLGGLELARSGALALRQDHPWRDIQMSRCGPTG
jgi:segregation and condensation protein A